MAFKNRFSRRTRLQLALDRGMRPGADLAHELGKLHDYSITSREDAEAICSVLGRLVSTGPTLGDKSALHALITLFVDVESSECAAFAVMETKGIALILRIVNEALDNKSRIGADDVLLCLRILAMYFTPEGTDAVLRAARQPFGPDAFMWGPILGSYSEDHPESERVFKALSDPLPSEFLAQCLLFSANAALREGAQFPHPFNSVAGKEQLARWLADPDEEYSRYAMSAAGALPFITAPERDALLALAFDHPSPRVQLEAACSAAKLGREAGIRWLARACLNVNLTEMARHRLGELGRADAIPAEADDPDFNPDCAPCF